MKKRRSPFDRAFEKGCLAAMNGLAESDCPYKDHRKDNGRLTFSRAYRNAWRDGFRLVTMGTKNERLLIKESLTPGSKECSLARAEIDEIGCEEHLLRQFAKLRS